MMLVDTKFTCPWCGYSRPLLTYSTLAGDFVTEFSCEAGCGYKLQKKHRDTDWQKSRESAKSELRKAPPKGKHSRR
jgi:ribosomal protein L37E